MEYYIIALKRESSTEYLFEFGENSEVHLSQAQDTPYAKEFKTFKQAQDLINNALPKPIEGYWEVLIQYYE